MMNMKLSENFRGGYSRTKKPLTKFMMSALKTSHRLLKKSRMHIKKCIAGSKNTSQHTVSICSAMPISAAMKLPGKVVRRYE
ncbi:MAG: hypothetical protein Q4E91_06040 [Lachnospiraceae bacterium]|nr:hypothetical protein [Lachnospiraceae bacterium]